MMSFYKFVIYEYENIKLDNRNQMYLSHKINYNYLQI